MKNFNLIFFLLLFLSISSFGQEKSFPELIETDSTWGKEIFEFPIRFAKEIDYTGYEEAKFPKGWSNRDTLTFWSYAFAWHIDLDTVLSERILEKNIELYFDGLNEIDIKRKNGIYIPNTSALFLQKDKSTYIGKVRTFDRFTTKKLFQLNVILTTKYCPRKKKTTLLFKFSPKDLEHEVWDILGKLKIHKEVCNY